MTTPRHIALYLPSLRGGGAERVMMLLANGFAARGHRVDLVLVQADGPYLDEVSPEVRIVDLRGRRAVASLWPLARYLRRERPDAMLSALTHTNIIAIWARMLSRVPLRFVVSEHNSPSQSMTGRAMRMLVSRFYPRADAIVCVSKGAQDEMGQIFPHLRGSLHTIYNPHDLDTIQRRMQEPLDHPWLGNPDIPVILAAGRLTRQKDYPNLLRAMALLLERRQARLIILGQGEEEAALRQMAADLDIADQVEFAGFQKNPYAWMHRCDLYVMSSAWEGLPNTLIEALACGAKVVSTDCRTGPREILEGGKWGRLVPVGDDVALAEAMVEGLEAEGVRDPQERARDFEPEGIVSAYLRLLGA